VTLPVGKDAPAFRPVPVKSRLADPATQPWPMGDVLPKEPLPAGLDAARIKQAVDAAFDRDGMTAAFVVTWKGRVIGERYGDGITLRTPLEGWSMGKSIIASASPTCSGCRAGSGSGRPRIPTTIRRGPTPTTPSSTPAASTPSATRRGGRCSGRPTRSDATATPIPCR
jgi:hypothetical protein